MGILGKLFGKKQEGGGVATADPEDGSAFIKTYDAQGQEVFIPREQWRRHILPDTLRRVQDDPEQLGVVLDDAVREGFAAEALPYAERLREADPQSPRGTALLASVYVRLGRLGDGERLLNGFLAAQGEEATVLASLGNVYSFRGDPVQAEAAWWRAVELAPNHWGALASCMVAWRERGGEAMETEGLRRVAALPGSWRARLWLARNELEANDLPAALALYQEALTRAGRPAPADLLFQMSGDLGQHGHFTELLALAEPPFDVALHGLPTGNNLIKAHFELGQYEAARRLLHLLRAQAQPDWWGALGYWQGELDRVEGAR